MNYHLTTEHFEGPFEKLLELIENEKLDITLVSLAKITDEFISHIKELEQNNESHTLVADFLLIASKLILIKSKILLPAVDLNEEEEVEIADLETRLKLYSELKSTRAEWKKLWHNLPLRFGREYLKENSPVFAPGNNLTTETLLKRLEIVLGELERSAKPKITVKEEVMRLKERIEHILERISKTPVTLSSFRINATKGELVVFFLAILHIAKDQLAKVEQNESFGDICIKHQSG